MEQVPNAMERVAPEVQRAEENRRKYDLPLNGVPPLVLTATALRALGVEGFPVLLEARFHWGHVQWEVLHKGEWREVRTLGD
jgi:hypothetical protein